MTTFIPGQSVVWLSRLLRAHGPDQVDGHTVSIVMAEVVRIGTKRALIRVASGGRSRLTWVALANLRSADDPAVVAALNARAGAESP